MATKRALMDRAGRNKAAQPTVKPVIGLHVIGVGGRLLTLADLPLPDTKRWVIRRKAEVVAAVRGGLLSMEEACSRYALSADEVLAWQYRIDCFGIAGLSATRTQFYPRHNRRLGEPSAWSGRAGPAPSLDRQGSRPHARTADRG
jgi:Protein of unknown function (DUF1153)